MPRYPHRLCLLGACLFSAWLVTGAAAAFGQSGQVTTGTVSSQADGRAIHYTYFPAIATGEGTENAAVVILLHGKSSDRLVWEQKGAGKTGKSFAIVLQDQGYAVISVDLRKHGQSKAEDEKDVILRPNDYKAMLGDLEAIKAFLHDEHQAKRLNINKTAIIAADDMAPVAVAYAHLDWQKRPHDDAPVTDPAARTPRGQDIRALVLLSPSQTAGAVNILGPMKALRDPAFAISLFVAYGTQDSEDRGTSKSLERIMLGSPKNKDRVYLKEYEVKFRGTDLTAKSILVEVPILQFLDQHLKQLDSEWRDRRSRLER